MLDKHWPNPRIATVQERDKFPEKLKDKRAGRLMRNLGEICSAVRDFEEVEPIEFMKIFGQTAIIYYRDPVVPEFDITTGEFLGMIPAMNNSDIHHILPEWCFKLQNPNLIASYFPLRIIPDLFGEQYFSGWNDHNTLPNMIRVPRSLHNHIHQYPFREIPKVIDSTNSAYPDLSKDQVMEKLLSEGVPMWDLRMAEILSVVSLLNTNAMWSRLVDRIISLEGSYPFLEIGDVLSKMAFSIEILDFAAENVRDDYPDVYHKWAKTMPN